MHGALALGRRRRIGDLPALGLLRGLAGDQGTDLLHRAAHGADLVAPVAPEGLTEKPLLDLDAGYILRAQGEFPKQGGADPWVMRQSYVPDRRTALRADVTDAMEFGTTPVRPGSPVAVGG